MPEHFAPLQPHLEPIALALRRVLIEPKQPIEHVYFHERGYTSVGRQVGARTADKYAGAVAVLLVEDEVPVRMAGAQGRVVKVLIPGGSKPPSVWSSDRERYFSTWGF